MTRKPVRVAAAAAAMAAALSLGACTTDDAAPTAEPSTPPPSAPATPSPSPSTAVAAEPDRPAAMDDGGQAGAEAAALYFVSLDAYMQATGDTTEWESMSHPSCEFCANRLEQARAIAEHGDTFTGGSTSVEIVETYAQDPLTGIWPIDVIVHEDATQIIRTNGEVAFTKEAGSFSARVEVAQRDGAWVVVELASATAL